MNVYSKDYHKSKILKIFDNLPKEIREYISSAECPFQDEIISSIGLMYFKSPNKKTKYKILGALMHTNKKYVSSANRAINDSYYSALYHKKK